MKDINNPFVVYGYKGAQYFCDREDETERIISALSNERNIVLIAPRRIGKTGLIKHVFSSVATADKDTKCIYLDIFSTQNLNQFVSLLAQKVIGQLDTPSQSTLRRIANFFSSCRPTVSFDTLTGLPTVSVDVIPNEERQTLEQIFRYIEASHKRCYIAIDEFQQILDYPEKGVEALLRSFIQFVPNVYFVFAGSQQHLMSDMFVSANRPFFQSSQVVALDVIDENTYYKFANDFFAKRKIDFPQDAFHHLYALFSGHTWYLQSVLNRIYENERKHIDDAVIDKHINELIDEQSSVYQSYLPLLTSNQINLMTAIAKEGSVRRLPRRVSSSDTVFSLPAASIVPYRRSKISR